MEELKENNAPRDRAILVGLSSPRLDRKENADEESLEELGALVGILFPIEPRRRKAD